MLIQIISLYILDNLPLHYNMEKLSALLAICEGNLLVTNRAVIFALFLTWTSCLTPTQVAGELRGHDTHVTSPFCVLQHVDRLELSMFDNSHLLGQSGWFWKKEELIIHNTVIKELTCLLPGYGVIHVSGLWFHINCFTFPTWPVGYGIQSQADVTGFDLASLDIDLEMIKIVLDSGLTAIHCELKWPVWIPNFFFFFWKWLSVWSHCTALNACH